MFESASNLIPRMITWSCALLIAVAAIQQRQAAAQTPARGSQSAVQDFRSANFLVHTDLTAEEAESLLERLETMLKIISRYWGIPNGRSIECYVVKDLTRWPAGSLSPELQRTVQGGGVTIGRTRTLAGRSNTVAVVYASSRFGTPQHEAVHAYCYQTFGRTGPTWYAEGMAEMGNYWIEDDPGVTAPDYVLRFLKQSERKTLAAITDNRQQTGDGWRNYAWRWALCHFLANNNNYAERFRALGTSLLTGQKNSSFDRMYASVRPELDFEFQFFLDHMQPGFEAGRCTWNWAAKHRVSRNKTPVKSTIRADAGWQPSGLKVEKGQTYSLRASGIWQPDAATQVSANGDADGRGRLVGVIFSDYQLTESFELGRRCTFTAEQDGLLMLRCSDAWNQLTDNAGTVSVMINASEKESSETDIRGQ